MTEESKRFSCRKRAVSRHDDGFDEIGSAESSETATNRKSEGPGCICPYEAAKLTDVPACLRCEAGACIILIQNHGH
jgi:hypothetical protein